MATIAQIVAQIRTAVLGKDVRESIAEGIETCYSEEVDKNRQLSLIKMNNPINAGSLGMLLRNNGNGTTSWAEYGSPTDAQVEIAVVEWLDNHPEATSTVEDGSITTIKFNGAHIPFYNVNDYGIMPGNSDVYSALHDFLATYVYNTGGIVYFPAGKYVISYTIFIPENTTFIGDGENTEIYFNEQDTAFGVGLANAGSNITIRNMKVSHASTGIFHSGAQPGAIGFSDLSKEQALVGEKVHTFIRATCKNLKAENITFGGFYAIQTENSHDYTITNVVYKNLYAPDSCVSVAPGAEINNIIVENVVCDLFRVKHSNYNAGLFNGQFNNIICTTFIFNPSQNNERINIIVNNLMQHSGARKNDVLDSGTSGQVNGDIVFNDCKFYAMDNETSGIVVVYGKRYWNRCRFDMKDKVVTRSAELLGNTNYEIMNSCIIDVRSPEHSSVLLGYGSHNVINADTVNNMLWGNMYSVLTDFNHTGIGSASNTHPSVFSIINDRVYLCAYFTFENTNSLFTLSSKLQNLPIIKGKANPFLVTIWNANSGNRITTYANIDETTNVVSVTQPGYVDSESYDRGLINIELKLSRDPTPLELYDAIS